MYQFWCGPHETITVVVLLGISILLLENCTACLLSYSRGAIEILYSELEEETFIIHYSGGLLSMPILMAQNHINIVTIDSTLWYFLRSRPTSWIHSHIVSIFDSGRRYHYHSQCATTPTRLNYRCSENSDGHCRSTPTEKREREVHTEWQ